MVHSAPGLSRWFPIVALMSGKEASSHLSSTMTEETGFGRLLLPPARDAGVLIRESDPLPNFLSDLERDWCIVFAFLEVKEELRAQGAVTEMLRAQTWNTHSGACLIGIAFLCLTAGCHKSSTNNPPPVHLTPPPKQAPVHLEVSTIEKFVDWVSSMPVSQVPDVKKEIALVASNTALVDAIAGKLSLQSPVSYGRQLIYLSILGEMNNENALGPLSRYMNSTDCPVYEERAVAEPAASPSTTYFDYCAGLKSAAINMISYINSQAAQQIVLQAVHDHPSRAVRMSGMNSFLYNQNDSADAVELVRRHARANEVKLVGLPRLTPQYSLKEFSERFARFYAEHPEEVPQLPGREEGNLGKRNVQPHVPSSLAPSKGPS